MVFNCDQCKKKIIGGTRCEIVIDNVLCSPKCIDDFIKKFNVGPNSGLFKEAEERKKNLLLYIHECCICHKEKVINKKKTCFGCGIDKYACAICCRKDYINECGLCSLSSSYYDSIR